MPEIIEMINAIINNAIVIFKSNIESITNIILLTTPCQLKSCQKIV